MATDLERLVVSLEANVVKFEKELKRASSVTDKELGAVERRFLQSNRAVAGSTANLAAQFQDIAVQLQGGASPLTVALQQGTQISQVIGQQGAAGAVKLLGGAFTSLISPVSLLTVGVIALGGAAVKWLTSSSDELKTLDELLQEHGQLVKSLKDSYGEAGKGLDQLFRDNAAVIETLMRGSIVALQEQYRKLATDAVKSMTDTTAALSDMGDAAEQAVVSVVPEYGRFKDAIENLRASVVGGVPDVKAFRAAVAEIEATETDPKIRRLAGALLEMTKEADKAASALITSQRAIAETGNIASGSAGAVRKFSSALSDLAKLGLPDLDDRARALQALQKALENTRGNKGAINAAEAEYLASIDRIAAREKEAADKKAADEAQRLSERNARRKAADERNYQQDIENVRKSTAALDLEFQMIGKTAQERDKARMLLQLESEARKSNIVLTKEQREEIEAVATAYAEANERARQAGEVMAAFQEFGSAASDAFKGLVLQGEKLDVVLQRLLERLASRAFDKIFDALFSGLGSSVAGSGFSLSSLFGGARAGGGPVSAGRAYLVGEKRPELFVPNRGGVIVPRVAQASPGRSDVTVNLVENSARAGQTERRDGGSGLDLTVFVDSITARNVANPGSATRRVLGSAGQLVRR